MLSYSSFEYNASGLQSKSSTYNASNQRTGYDTYEYNASGLLSKLSMYNASSQRTGYNTYEANASGQISKASSYDASGHLLGYSTCEYSASGQMSKFSAYSNGQLQSYSTFEYNASGLRSKDSSYNASGQLVGYNLYEYSVETTVASPVFSTIPGTYTAAQSVTLSCATAGATIRYTTDNTEPNESSTAYTSSIGVSTTTTIKAKAFKSGWTASATVTGSYTITTPRQLTGMGLSNGVFRFFLNGPVGSNYVIQVSSNWVNWSLLGAYAIPAGGSVPVTDAAAGFSSRRFYQAVLTNASGPLGLQLGP